MYCENCGVEVVNGSEKCSNCGKVITLQDKEVNEGDFEGKKFEFTSTGGLGGTIRRRVYSTVDVGSDRLSISITPAKKNLVPEIKFEDIVEIKLSKMMSKWHIALAIIAFLDIFLTGYPWWILVSALLLWTGRNTRISILQRNGVNAIIYSRSKLDAETFKKEMEGIVGIQQ